MATEILSVPEESLSEVIGIIRSGIESARIDISINTREMLEKWCDEESEYLEDV